MPQEDDAGVPTDLLLESKLPPRPEAVQTLIDTLINIYIRSLTIHHAAESLRSTERVDRRMRLPELGRYLAQRKQALQEQGIAWDDEREQLETGFHAGQERDRTAREQTQAQSQKDYREWIAAIDAALAGLGPAKPFLEGAFSMPASAWVSKMRSTLIELRSYSMEIGERADLWDLERLRPTLNLIQKERQSLQTAELAESAPKKKRKRRKRPLHKQERSLTPLETHTLEVVARHKQNFAAAATELGRHPKTVRENYNRALAKANRIMGDRSRSVKAGRLPEDRRGQPSIGG